MQRNTQFSDRLRLAVLVSDDVDAVKQHLACRGFRVTSALKAQSVAVFRANVRQLEEHIAVGVEEFRGGAAPLTAGR